MTKDLTPKDVQSTQIAELFPPTDDESRILVGCRRGDYSASMISRAVEDCNAQVLNLNVTSLPSEFADLVIDLRVNHRNAEAISRSLMRYGYDVLAAKSSSPVYNEQMRSRANELLRYLEV
ncbi:MAG: hypothetical protein LIP03_11190 [Bacteroidales bacterium]|nr:hypothetical protein [Bacteroidales bacterium]